MKVLAADFVTSAAAGGSSDGIPRDGLPQIALAGRSNVGKSTLINALCRRAIARTSAAPGKTRLANVYRVTLQAGAARPTTLYLVDLPGYGYARGGADSAAELRGVAEAYFASRGSRSAARGSTATGDEAAPPDGGLRTADRGPAALLLVDARHPGLESDRQAEQWLAAMGVDYLVVATKIDKLSRSERARHLRALELTSGMPPLPVSAANGEGLDVLWKTIVRLARTGHATTDIRDGEAGAPPPRRGPTEASGRSEANARSAASAPSARSGPSAPTPPSRPRRRRSPPGAGRRTSSSSARSRT